MFRNAGGFSAWRLCHLVLQKLAFPVCCRCVIARWSMQLYHRQLISSLLILFIFLFFAFFHSFFLLFFPSPFSLLPPFLISLSWLEKPENTEHFNNQYPWFALELNSGIEICDPDQPISISESLLGTLMPKPHPQRYLTGQG